jgi:peptide/nickel transport system substrate-binding protein
LQEVQSVEAPDGETVVIKLKKPVPYFIMIFPSVAVPIMPKHIYDGTEYAKNPANATPIGTGPFKLDQWRRGAFLRLVKNEHYWKKDRPMVDSITFRIIPDAASRAIALETGDIQIATGLDLSSSDIKRFQASKDFDITANGWEYLSQINMLVFNQRKPILNDARFRQALYHATDRQLVLDRIWQGVGKIATGPISSKIPFYTKDVRPYNFDPAKSKALLDELGLRADASGARTDASGNRLKVSVTILPGDERYAQLGQYLREAWGAVGVEVNLQVTDTAGWEARIRNWDFDILMNSLSQWGDPGFGARRYYVSSNIKKGLMFNNESGYSNAEVDKWFEEAGLEMNPARRAELYARIQRKLIDDAAMIWLLEVEQLTISSKRVRNVITTAFGPRGPWDELQVVK